MGRDASRPVVRLASGPGTQAVDVTQFCKVHGSATANNADGGEFDLDGATTNFVLHPDLSWNNNGYGYQLYDFFGGPAQNNTARYNVTIDDAKVTSSRPTRQGVLAAFGNLINESFHHNIVFAEDGELGHRELVQFDAWPADGLAFHDDLHSGKTLSGRST